MLVKPFLKKLIIYPGLWFSSTKPPNIISPNPEINKILGSMGSEMISKTPYIHKFNYNFEQNRNYTKTVQKALVAHNEKLKKDQIKLANPNLLNRRKRRVYDRPLHDLDLKNYSAWRVYDLLMPKFNEEEYIIPCKILTSPALLKKVFGRGLPTERNYRATREYDFQDNNLDRFIVYDYNWVKSRKKNSKKKYLEEDFWKSEELHYFRVNCTRYADFRKFKKWIQNELETKKDEASYEEQFIKKHGDIETFDDYDKKYELNKEVTVFKYNWKFYMEKNDKIEVNFDFPYSLMPAKCLDDKYKIEKPELVKYSRIIIDKSIMEEIEKLEKASKQDKKGNKPAKVEDEDNSEKKEKKQKSEKKPKKASAEEEVTPESNEKKLENPTKKAEKPPKIKQEKKDKTEVVSEIKPIEEVKVVKKE